MNSLFFFLQKLERSHHFWILLATSFLFFFLRLPSLFEPSWYGDEGIYQTIGYALNHEDILYRDIWDNKPPLLYVVYAVGGGSLFFAKALSLISGLLAVISFFFLAKKVFVSENISLLATLFFSILFGLPFIEGNIANAENFMLFPIILSALIIYSLLTKKLKKEPLFIAGILLGISFLFKIVAIFDAVAFLLFMITVTLPETITRKSLRSMISDNKKSYLFFITGIVLPFLFSVVYFLFTHSLSDYLQAAFRSTVGYVGNNNMLIFPQGLLVIKLLLLIATCVSVFIYRKRLQTRSIFIILWISFSLFNSFFSQREYTHYVLVLLPAMSLLFGWIFISKGKKQWMITGLFLIISCLSLSFFNHWSVTKTFSYYNNFIQFESGEKSLAEYQNFFDTRTSSDYQIASYISSKKKSEDTIYVWGDSAQLYYLTKSLPPTRFSVSYHITGNKEYLAETEKSLSNQDAKYIIIQSGSTPYPYSLSKYAQSFTIAGNTVYERIF